jgi:hypothetical protein
MLTPKNQAGPYKKMDSVDKKKMYQDTVMRKTTSMSKSMPIKKVTEKVTTTMGVDKSKGLMPGKPTSAPMPVSKAKQIASNIASKLKRG